MTDKPKMPPIELPIGPDDIVVHPILLALIGVLALAGLVWIAAPFCIRKFKAIRAPRRW